MGSLLQSSAASELTVHLRALVLTGPQSPHLQSDQDHLPSLVVLIYSFMENLSSKKILHRTPGLS